MNDRFNPDEFLRNVRSEGQSWSPPYLRILIMAIGIGGMVLLQTDYGQKLWAKFLLTLLLTSENSAPIKSGDAIALARQLNQQTTYPVQVNQYMNLKAVYARDERTVEYVYTMRNGKHQFTAAPNETLIKDVRTQNCKYPVKKLLEANYVLQHTFHWPDGEFIDSVGVVLADCS